MPTASGTEAMELVRRANEVGWKGWTEVQSIQTQGFSPIPAPMPGSRRAAQRLGRPNLPAPSSGQRRCSCAATDLGGWKVD
jgi:hypothetical protein